MFRKPQSLVMKFKKPVRVSLHMIFVFFSIDLAFLNRDYKVIELKRNFRPFSFYMPKTKASLLIETPAGNLKTTQIGDILSIEKNSGDAGKSENSF